MPGGFQGDAQASYLLIFCYFKPPPAPPKEGSAWRISGGCPGFLFVNIVIILLLFCYFFCPQELPSLGGAGGGFLPPYLSLSLNNPLVGGNLLEGHRTTRT